MKKKKTALMPIIIITIFILAISSIYVGIMIFYNNHFLPNTYINSVEIGNMSVEDVNILFEDEVSNYTLIVTDLDGNKEYILSSDYSLTYLENNQIQEIKDAQNNAAWILSLFAPAEYQLTIESAYDTKQLTDRIHNMNIITNAQEKAPEDAYLQLDIENNLYTIVPEVIGSSLDVDAVLAEIHNAIAQQQTEIQLSDHTIYTEPAITANHPALVKEMESKNAILELTITHTFGTLKENERVLTGKEIVDWLTYDDDFNIVSVDSASVEYYVYTLARDFNTFGSSRPFRTSGGQDIIIKGGDYGWIIDQKSEAETLTALIMNLESTTREPAYEATAATHDGIDTGEPDIYVEIDLSRQYLWYYVNGAVKVETDIVSGMKDRSPTREGTFSVMWKEQKWRLRGETYDVVVDYFIPFYTDVGLHDANWQSTFGGNVYHYAGSYGCINTPLDKVKEIYEHIAPGTIVYTYYSASDGPQASE
jgi:Uncharacterized protein conserved in bacteria